MENTIIYLKNSTDARSFTKGELIHNESIEKVRMWINERLKHIDEIKESKQSDQCSDKYIEGQTINTTSHRNTFPSRVHGTISVLGSRGSGKTSFLNSISEMYKNNSDIAILNPIDPTLIEEKGHIFLTILSDIKRLVEEKLGKYDSNPEYYESRLKETWRYKLRKLARGIPSIGGMGGMNEGWQDPEFIMDNGLRDVKAAKDLENDFQELIEFGLCILKKKAFLLILDDIDVDFRKGWSVLETLRKYLTSPYIITILSGDLELFSKAIRKHQWSTFGKALLVNEADKQQKIKRYDDLVTQMEDQYVQKVLQSNRRIHLNTIQEKINIHGTDKHAIFINDSSHESDIRIDDYINLILADKFGIINKSQQEVYRSFLLNMPLRSIIQLFLALKDDQRLKSLDFLDLFTSEVYNEEIDLELVRSNDKFLIPIILEYLIRKGALNDSYQLQPTKTDRGFNSVVVALTLLFNLRAKERNYLILEYIIKIGYIRNISYELLPPKLVAYSSNRRLSINKLCQYSTLFNDRNFHDAMGLTIASIWAIFEMDIEHLRPYVRRRKKNEIWGGNVQIHSLNIFSKKTENESKYIDSLLKGIQSIAKRKILSIPISISQANYKDGGITSFSFPLLLASIADIIKRHGLGEKIRDIISDLSQINTYTMPELSPTIPEIESEGIRLTDIEDGVSNICDDDKLEGAIETWLEDSKRIFTTTPVHLLGKISTRYLRAFRSFETNKIPESVADIMHAYTIIFLNSVLVEESREKLKNNRLSNNNPQNSSRIFIDNLNSIDGKDLSTLTLFTWFLTCPLIYAFINPSLYELHNNSITQHLNKTLDPNDSDEQITENKETESPHGSKNTTPSQNNYSEILNTIFKEKDLAKLSVYDALKDLLTKRSNIPPLEYDESELNESDKIWFYTGQKSYKKTIEILIKCKVSYDALMLNNVDTAYPVLNEIFQGGVTNASITKLKDLIEKK